MTAPTDRLAGLAELRRRMDAEGVTARLTAASTGTPLASRLRFAGPHPSPALLDALREHADSLADALAYRAEIGASEPLGFTVPPCLDVFGPYFAREMEVST